MKETPNQSAAVVTAETVREAARILERYKAGKASLEQRIVENEMWFRMRHWDRRAGDRKKNASAWLFNSIATKHADFMDALPECTVLPREESDIPAAEILSKVVPVILENNGFERVYSDATMYKLKTGTAVYAVLWNPQADRGVGDIEIAQTDLLNLFWEPGIRKIQDSRHLFHVSITDNETLIETYPFLAGKLSQPLVDIKQYISDDAVENGDKSAVVDWYYKKRVNGQQVLHYCKFVGSEVLYASENDPQYAQRGYYDHGKYPFVFDPLYNEEGSPVGFGFIDVMKDAQEAIDVLGTEVLRNARMAARRRYFTRTDGAVNEAEFADWDKDFVHVSGSSLGEESLREIDTQPLPGVYLTVLQSKIEELKETSANRDFSQGGTMGGVTSGVAISALQEAGSKLSRSMVNASYRSFSELCLFVIELIRQFYNTPRMLRITDPNGIEQFVSLDNSALLARPQTGDFGVEYGDRLPVFDVRVKAHKMNPFSRTAQNQDAINFFQMGMFDPARYKQALACLELLDIENKDRLISAITRNGMEYEAQQAAAAANAAAFAQSAQNGETQI